MDPEDVKKGLARSGKTQHGLAKALGVDDAAITRMLQGKREIKARELPTIRAYLELPEEKPGKLGTTGAWARDVPVLGTAVGGSNGDFMLNTGDIVDYARRPPTVARSAKVFVLFRGVENLVLRHMVKPRCRKRFVDYPMGATVLAERSSGLKGAVTFGTNIFRGSVISHAV